MSQFFAIFSLIVVGAGLACPLLYALETLSGMRHRKIYPIFGSVLPDK
jgi:hypothetical protein